MFGSAARHAELAYLTNFVPKLEPGIALLVARRQSEAPVRRRPQHDGRDEAPHLHRRHGAAQCAGEADRRMEIAVAGRWRAMSSAVRKTIDDATNGTAQDATAQVQKMMRHKSPSELAAIRDACGSLNKAMTAIREAVRSAATAPQPRCWPANARQSIPAHRISARCSASTAGARCGRSRGSTTAIPIRSRSTSRCAGSTTGRKALRASSGEPQPALSLAALLMDNALSAIARGTAGRTHRQDRRRRGALSPSSGDARRAGQRDRPVARCAADRRCSSPARSIRCAPASPTAPTSMPSSPPWSRSATMAPMCCGGLALPKTPAAP